MTGRTPGLSSGGGKKRTLANRQAGKAAKLASQAARMAKEAEILNNKAEMLEEKAEKLEEKAEKMAEKSHMRINAPEYMPPKNLLNRLALNKSLANKENELMKMMRNENEENSNNFNNLMRNVHKKRINNDD